MPGKDNSAATPSDPHKEMWDRYLLLRRELEKLDHLDKDKPKKAVAIQQLSEARNQLMDAYLPLLKSCAIRLKGGLPNFVELDDLYNSGVFGLADAIERYDPARGIKFTTFAPLRITGAMLDHLRSIDRVPRLVRDRAKKLERAISKYTKQHGRPPTQDELAKLLGINLKELQRILDDGQVVGEVSLDQPINSKSQTKDMGMAEILGDPAAVSPIDAAHKRSLKELFCKMLSRHERLIVMLYYYEGMTMKEIGQTLDLSESRVSQMHTLVKERLRVHLNGRDDLLAG